MGSGIHCSRVKEARAEHITTSPCRKEGEMDKGGARTTTRWLIKQSSKYQGQAAEGKRQEGFIWGVATKKERGPVRKNLAISAGRKE